MDLHGKAASGVNGDHHFSRAHLGEREREGFAARINEINNNPTLKSVDEHQLADGRVVERTTGPVSGIRPANHVGC